MKFLKSGCVGTVLSRSCMLADAMATALIVMGHRPGSSFARGQAASALFLRCTLGGIVATGTGVFDIAAE